MKKHQVKKDEAATVQVPDISFLPKKDIFRVDEAAVYFGVEERTIRLWIQHGKLESEKINGCLRIPRRSIIDCRFPRKSEML